LKIETLKYELKP